MATLRQFIAKIDDYNARMRAAEKVVSALNTEKDILRIEAADYMRVSQFDEEIGRVTFKFTFPDDVASADQPAAPTGEQAAGPAITRHGEQAAE
jgi:hypothetical protein